MSCRAQLPCSFRDRSLGGELWYSYRREEPLYRAAADAQAHPEDIQASASRAIDPWSARTAERFCRLGGNLGPGSARAITTRHTGADRR